MVICYRGQVGKRGEYIGFFPGFYPKFIYHTEGKAFGGVLGQEVEMEIYECNVGDTRRGIREVCFRFDLF